LIERPGRTEKERERGGRRRSAERLQRMTPRARMAATWIRRCEGVVGLRFCMSDRLRNSDLSVMYAVSFEAVRARILAKRLFASQNRAFRAPASCLAT